jgi:hypothetical protein
MSRAMKWGIFGGVVFVSLVTLCLGGGYAAYRFFSNLGVSQTTFDAIAIGAPEAEARKDLPSRLVVPADEVYRAGDQIRSGMPSDATCDHYLSKEQPDGGGTGLRVYRFCFKDGKVVEKKDIPPQSDR